MKCYNKIPIWENKERLKLLIKFRRLLNTYFNNVVCVMGHPSAEPIENETTQKARVEINLVLSEVYEVLLNSGVDPIIRYSPPPITGGYIQDIDVFHNIFNLRQFKIPNNKLFDFIDIAIGIYCRDSKRAWMRTFNPFYWVGCALDYIVRLPFALLDRIGFDSDKAESSTIGRCIKGFLYLIVVFAALLTILYYLDYLEQFKGLIQKKPPAP